MHPITAERFQEDFGIHKSVRTSRENTPSKLLNENKASPTHRLRLTESMANIRPAMGSLKETH